MQKDLDAFNNMGSVSEGPKKGIFNNMNVKKNPQEPIVVNRNPQPKVETKPPTAYQPKVVPAQSNIKI